MSIIQRAWVREHVVISSDSGAVVLPPPVEALREFIMMLIGCGIGVDAIRCMVRDTPGRLFRVAAAPETQA